MEIFMNSIELLCFPRGNGVIREAEILKPLILTISILTAIQKKIIFLIIKFYEV